MERIFSCGNPAGLEVAAGGWGDASAAAPASGHHPHRTSSPTLNVSSNVSSKEASELLSMMAKANIRNSFSPAPAPASSPTATRATATRAPTSACVCANPQHFLSPSYKPSELSSVHPAFRPITSVSPLSASLLPRTTLPAIFSSSFPSLALSLAAGLGEEGKGFGFGLEEGAEQTSKTSKTSLAVPAHITLTPAWEAANLVNCVSEPDGSTMEVRSGGGGAAAAATTTATATATASTAPPQPQQHKKTKHKKKIPSAPCLLGLLGADALYFAKQKQKQTKIKGGASKAVASSPSSEGSGSTGNERFLHVSPRENSFVRRLRERTPFVSREESPLVVVVNMCLPWGSLITYYHSPPMAAGTAAADHWEKFIDPETTDDWRNQHIKLIPRVVTGPWVVRKLVGSTPVLLGTRLPITYEADFESLGYFEMTINVSKGTKLANSIASGVMKKAGAVTTDIAFVVEGREPAQLPEGLLGVVRMHHLDCAKWKTWEDHEADLGGKVEAKVP